MVGATAKLGKLKNFESSKFLPDSLLPSSSSSLPTNGEDSNSFSEKNNNKKKCFKFKFIVKQCCQINNLIQKCFRSLIFEMHLNKSSNFQSLD